MVRANGEPVVLEVNTLPGMTETSLLPKAAAAAGLSYRGAVPADDRSGVATKLRGTHGRQPAFTAVRQLTILTTMWFKREQKNRRLNRGHVLDVKLRSDQARAPARGWRPSRWA